MTQISSPRIEAPELLTACVVIIWAGCAALVIGNIVGSMMVPGHDFVADTVSDLAAGELEIIQDVTLYGFAAALIAAALGAAQAHPGGKQWSLGLFSLALTAAFVVIIAARNEYGDGDSEGVVIHIYIVYALGVSFTAAFLSMSRGLAIKGDGWRWASVVCAVLWIIGALGFFASPDGIDGLIERLVGIVAVAWLCGFGVWLKKVS